MQRTEKKAALRTPDQMAKVAMRELAKKDLESNGYSTEIKVTVEYMGVRHHLTATPTVKLETGDIGFYCGARGRNALPFELKGTEPFAFGLGLNVSSGFKLDPAPYKAILDKYGLEISEVQTKENEDLEAGETV